LEIGKPDGAYEWECSGEFNFVYYQTADLSGVINDYLSTCTADPNGYCEIPLLFHSDTDGKIEITDVNIIYINIGKTQDISGPINSALSNGDCDCNGCIVEDECCLIPITVRSESPGILRLSDLRIIYESMECDKANLDGEGLVCLYDLSLFAEDYAETGPYLIGDINRVEKTNLKDFALLAQYWLTTCNCN